MIQAGASFEVGGGTIAVQHVLDILTSRSASSAKVRQSRIACTVQRRNCRALKRKNPSKLFRFYPVRPLCSFAASSRLPQSEAVCAKAEALLLPAAMPIKVAVSSDRWATRNTIFSSA